MLRKRQLIIDYHQKFGDEQGKRILEDLRKRTRLIHDGVLYSGGVDVNMLLVMEGEANVVKYIYRMLGKDPNEPSEHKAINRVGE